MTKTTLLTAAVLLAVTSTGAFAKASVARFKQQNAAIEYGRQTGEITWREGKQLRREQNAIASRKFELESDGWLSKRDRRELNYMQNRAAENIADESHDGRRRPWWLPRVGR